MRSVKPHGRIASGSPRAGHWSHTFDLAGIIRQCLAVDARIAAAIGAAIVVLAGVPLAAALNIWIDEAFTLHTTGAGPLDAWARAITFEAQPPLYFFLEAAWRTLDETSITFARFPSVALAAASVAVIVLAAQRIVPRVPPLAVALVTATNPLVIWAAVEMRVYPLVLFIGACLTWTFFEGFLSSRPSRRAQIAYAIFAILGLYAQYYAGFFLVAHAITLLVARRSAVRAFAVATVIIAAAFAPFIRVALMHLGASGEFVLRVPFSHAVHEVANAVFMAVLPHDINWFGAAKIAGFGLAAAVLILLVALGRPEGPSGATRAFVLQWIICLAVFSLLFTVTGVPLGPQKYMTVVAPSSLLIALWFVSSLRRKRVLMGSIAVAVYAVFTITALWTQYRPPLMKLGDWQRVAATLTGGNPSTPVAVFPPEVAEPLRWYLPPAMIAIPKPMPFTLDYVRRSTLTNESEVARVLDPVRARSERLWIVTTGECRESQLTYYDYHCRYLEAYLNRWYRVVRSIAFRGALARLYVRFPKLSADTQVRRNAN